MHFDLGVDQYSVINDQGSVERGDELSMCHPGQGHWEIKKEGADLTWEIQVCLYCLVDWLQGPPTLLDAMVHVLTFHLLSHWWGRCKIMMVDCILGKYNVIVMVGDSCLHGDHGKGRAPESWHACMRLNAPRTHTFEGRIIIPDSYWVFNVLHLCPQMIYDDIWGILSWDHYDGHSSRSCSSRH